MKYRQNKHNFVVFCDCFYTELPVFCVAGANGEVRLPVEDDKDLEENLEETLVCP